MLYRREHLQRVRDLLRRHPVVAILGARQVGKSTLASQVARDFRGPIHRFDLEHPEDLRRLRDPSLVLEPLRGLVVLDEIHRLPDIFPLLRVLADRPRAPARFLVLGSASLDLLRQASESLAGRIAFHDLAGFNLSETGPEKLKKLWFRGGFPRSFTARNDAESWEWRSGFVRTFLDRDMPQFGVRIPAPVMGRFWAMLAHVHGCEWNASDLASSFGVAHTTIRHYLDFLTATFMIRQLRPWHENLKKRQVRTPKIYFADSGMLHYQLDIREPENLLTHPKAGLSWEGFALGEIVARLGAEPHACWFWATHNRAELDLLVTRGQKRFGYEFKLTRAPVMTKSMHVSMADLKLDSLDVIHAGDKTWPMAPRVRAVALSRLLQDIRPL